MPFIGQLYHDDFMVGLDRRMIASVSVVIRHLACLKKSCNRPVHESHMQELLYVSQCVQGW